MHFKLKHTEITGCELRKYASKKQILHHLNVITNTCYIEFHLKYNKFEK